MSSKVATTASGTSKRAAMPPLWLLGGAIALAPFGGSVHVSSLASIPRDLGAAGSGAITVSIFFGMLSASMIPEGWLSDRFGRRPLVLASLALLAMASLAAAAAPSMTLLLVARALQGMGAAGALVLARAAVRDGLEGQEATRAMTVVATLQTLGAALAPVLGGIVGWRWGFAGLGIAAAVVGVVATRKWVETRRPPPQEAQQSSGGVRALLGAPSFLPYTVALAAMTAVYFAFLSCAAALLVGSGLLSRRGFSLVLLVAAALSVLGGLLARAGAKRFSAPQLTLAGAAVVSCGVVGFDIAHVNSAGAVGWSASLFVYMLGNGMMMPAAIMSALQVPRSVAGLASSVLGTFQFLVGALAAASVEWFAETSHALAAVSSIAIGIMLVAIGVGWLLSPTSDAPPPAHRTPRLTPSLPPDPSTSPPSGARRDRRSSTRT